MFDMELAFVTVLILAFGTVVGFGLVNAIRNLR
jgi:hypothetical protein